MGQADGAEELTFGRIGGIVVGNDGAMFVYDADQTVGLIRMYAATGKYLRTVGAKGGGPGEYGQLNGLTVARNGDLLIWDGAGARQPLRSGRPLQERIPDSCQRDVHGKRSARCDKRNHLAQAT